MLEAGHQPGKDMEDVAARSEVKQTGVSRSQDVEKIECHKECNQVVAQKMKEIKRLNEHIKKLQKRLHDNSDQYDRADIEELDSESDFVNRKGYTRSNPQEQSSKILRCKLCSFETSTEAKLENHKNVKHPTIKIVQHVMKAL